MTKEPKRRSKNSPVENWAKDVNRHFSRDEIETTNKCMKKKGAKDP